MAIRDVSALPLSELTSLRGRRAVITGGAAGVGLATARRLAEAGASVLIGDLDAEAAARAAEAITRDFGTLARGQSLDVKSEASVIALADAAESQLGGLDIWVNNAGVFPLCPIHEMTLQAWENVLDINLRGTFLGAREAAARMKANGTTKGVIINLASVAGVRARNHLAHYTASKHGVLGLTKSFALELGPHGIRVLAVAPGTIDTPGLQKRGIPEATAIRSSSSPLGRMGVADDVARVVLFCALDMSMLMTGSTLMVDSGTTAS